MIKGIEKLTKEQIAHMERVNELHTKCVGIITPRKAHGFKYCII